MGRSYTPKYRVEMVLDNSARTCEQIAWDKRYGRANKANLAKLIASIESSTQPGGVNAHLGIKSFISATIVNQLNGDLVAFYAK